MKYQLNKFVESIFPWISLILFLIYYFGLLGSGLLNPYWDMPEGSDAILQATFIKTMIETGWVFSNDRLGAPFGMNFYDFPGADGTLLLFIKLITLFSSDATLVTNVFYVASFVFVFATALWVFRRFEIDMCWATAGAIIYACLPYHFLRGVNHLYLANYYVVPLYIWLATEIYLQGGNKEIESTKRPGWIYVILLLCMGTSGVYYAFFGLVVIFIAGLLGSLENRSFYCIKRAYFVIAVIIIGTISNLLPNILYRLSEGSNPEVATRVAIESEIYGLRIGQLLLPIWGHQSEVLASFARSYHDTLRPITEATSSALGIITGSGFILLLGVVFFGKIITSDLRINLFAKLNLALFLYAVVGGFGVLFALTVTPQFRGANRASVFIAFLSLLALFVFFKNKSIIWHGRKIYLDWWRYIFAIGLMLFALYDQIPVGARLQSSQSLGIHGRSSDGNAPSSWEGFAQFIRQIEGSVSHGGMIYQLPYLPFPESAPLYREGYNNLLRPYYYSSHSRWSYGSMRGRFADSWQKAIDGLALEERVLALRKSGFEGIYIERRAYADHGRGIESELRNLIGTNYIESADGQQAFYPLIPEHEQNITPAFTLNPNLGFYSFEHDEKNRWIWSKRHGRLIVYNFNLNEIPVVFRAQILSINERDLTIYVGEKAAKTLSLASEVPAIVELELNLDPGANVVSFKSNKSEVFFPSDPRALGFKVINPTVDFK